MSRGWIILVPLLGLVGCDFDSDKVAPRKRVSTDRTARDNQQISRLKLEVHERDLRIRELEDHAKRLTEKLQKAEFLNQQLREQLAAVGDAPSQRDRYKKQLDQQRLEVRRLLRRIKQLQQRLDQAATTAPAIGPAE